MADFYNLLQRDSANWQNCQLALAERGIDMTGIPTDGFADKIRSIATQTSDDLEQTPELRQFPDIRAGLTNSTVKMIFLRDGAEAIGVAVTLPAGKTGVITWGDGATTNLTASGAAVNYYHTWATWQTSSDGLEEYNIVTITGDVTVIAAIAAAVATPSLWPGLLWIAAASTTITGLGVTNAATTFGSNLCRVDLATPALINPMFKSCYNLVVFNFTGAFTLAAAGSNFIGAAMNQVTYTNANATSIANLFLQSKVKHLTLALNPSIAVDHTRVVGSNYMLRTFATNSAWGSFYAAFEYCYTLKEIDLSACLFSGISDFTRNVNLFSLTKLLFPSTGTGANRIPKPFATGMTSMGHIDISNSGLSRSALVEMFYSLPANAAARNLTITGSGGAADLSASEIAVATNKNWAVIR